MILKTLKEATREQHEGLETTVDIMNGMVTVEDYKRLLLKFYRFYLAAESELSKQDWSAVKYDFEGRMKLPKLEDDLEKLGLLQFAKSELRPWERFPEINGFEDGFGTLYVLEGATLGGQIIKRHLKEHLGVEEGSGGSFFNGYGHETGPKWKEFGETVTEYAEKFGGEERMVESAKQTFDSFRDCFVEEIAIA